MTNRDRLLGIFSDAGYELLGEKKNIWLNLWCPEEEKYVTFVYKDPKTKKVKTNREVMDFIKKESFDRGYVRGVEFAHKKLRDAFSFLNNA